MAEIKDVTIRINVKDGDIKKTKKDFDDLNTSVTNGSKQMTGSLDKMNNSLLSVGAAIGGAFAIKAVVGDAIKRITDFEKSMSSLSAITGVTGSGLDKLKNNVLQVASETKKSATEIANAFELVGSKAPKLLEDADALAAVTKEAIILSKATGEDLVSSAGSLTGVMNQFNLSADESTRIINALAAGSQKGAAPVGQISDAIDKFGTVANAANISVEQSIGLVETLAEKNINGAEAGTQLRNIILKLQSANIGFTDGVFNLNDALQEVKDRNLSAAESAKLFGLESVTAGNILVNGIETVDKYTNAVTGTSTAYEQAITQTDNLSTKTAELDATYGNFLLSLEDGTGLLSEFSKGVVETATNMLTFATNLNNGKGALASFQELIASQIESEKGLAEQSAVLGISQKNLALAYQNNGLVLEALGDKFKAGEITLDQYRTLVNKLAEGEKEAKESTEELTVATEEDTVATDNNIKSKEKQLTFLEKIAEKVKEAKDAIEENRVKSLIFEDDTSGEEDQFLKELGLDEDGLEKLKEAQEKRREINAEDKALELENNLANQEAQLEYDQAYLDAKRGIDEQLAFSALDLASAIAQASGDSAEAQIAALAFQKIAAVASIIINTQKANALIAATIPPPLDIPLVLKNNIQGGLQVATVLATAIPQFTGAAKKLKDGEIMIQGAGTETSDSIPALLSKNESVINAKSSKKNKLALKAINDDRFDEYLNRVLVQRLYSGKEKEVKQTKDKSEAITIDHVNGKMRILNPSSISKPIVDAFEEMNFVNRNTWQ